MNPVIFVMLTLFPVSESAAHKLEQKNIDNREAQFLKELGIYTIGNTYKIDKYERREGSYKLREVK